MSHHKILISTIPSDGHFNPLTQLALELKKEGHDIRWYTGASFEQKVNKLDIPFYPFKKAKEVNQHNIEIVYPERKAVKAGLQKSKFDVKYLFLEPIPGNIEDIKEIYEDFPFNLIIADSMFFAPVFIKHILPVKLITISIAPLFIPSKDLPPYGLGLLPATNFIEKMRDRFIKFMVEKVVFKESTLIFNSLLKPYNLPPVKGLFLDRLVQESDQYWHSGVPGFEYKASDRPEKLKFIGPLHPHKEKSTESPLPHWFDNLKGKKVLLISQGTFEPDHSKLIIPSLEAFKDSDYLLLVTTANQNTEVLKEKYPQSNIIIEDFIDFDLIMPSTDIYITNGGYGGTLLAIEHKLPMVAAGVAEGKNEICSRIGYFKIGINLKTEKPKPHAIKRAVETIIKDDSYKRNVSALKKEFDSYDTFDLVKNHLTELNLSLDS